MNAGFSNLYTLKAHLLGAAIQASTEFNDVILATGRGIAGMIENHCQRKFARTVGDTEIAPGDRCEFFLQRFPLEAITAIHVKHSEADGWEEQTVNDFVTTIDLVSGIVHTPPGADVGRYDSQVRFTFTGGFFWEQVEPTGEVGYPTAQPAGSTALPADVQLAWLMQCRIAWQAYDKLGIEVTKAGESEVAGTLLQMKLSPVVEKMLRPFIREVWI